MEKKMKMAEEMVREFLAFRGFTSTLQSFEKELGTDIGKAYQVDKILDLIFKVYIVKFELKRLIDLLDFFKNCFALSDSDHIAVVSKLEQSILRYYLIDALQQKKKDRVIEFFQLYGNDLLLRDDSWSCWFALPYLQKPHLDTRFKLFFSYEWYQTLHTSVRNFLRELFNESRIPALLKMCSERNTVDHLKKEIKQLNHRLSRTQSLLEEKEALLCQLAKSSRRDAGEASVSDDSHDNSRSKTEECPSDNADGCSSSGSGLASVVGSDRAFQNEEEFPEVEAIFQDTYMGHTSPISCCRFSPSGETIASASTDGAVRIWTRDSLAPTSRNATIYCGAEIMSLEWDCKSDRLLLMGTSKGTIKAWNVDAKRIVCNLNCNEAYPSIVDMKCSPREPIFVSAAASTRQGTNYFDKLGFASLTVWNMRTWKAMSVLPLGNDPPAITSLSFNHNGKLLAAAATDGMIHMFDMSACQQITGWPAHDSAISSILFGPDETSIFSLGADGNVFEWSLQNQGKIMWSRNCSRVCNPINSNYSHELALNTNGTRLLVTSNSLRAPIYQVRGMSGMGTLCHTGPITTVDWHPTLPIFLTGSADHSVRVTTIS